jgi:hypothetical protein
MTPKLQQSIAFVYWLLPAVINISGAKYVGVPQKVFMMDPASTNLDKPKSVTCKSKAIFTHYFLFIMNVSWPKKLFNSLIYITT